MNKSICQIENAIESLNIRLGNAEERTPELENKSLEISQTKRKKKKEKVK